MESTQIAWAAGLFEGEGSISVGDSHGNKTYYQVTLAMTDKDVVDRFEKAVQCGRRYVRAGQKDNWKDVYILNIGKQADQKKVLSLFLPYLGDRRAHKALDVLDYLECK